MFKPDYRFKKSWRPYQKRVLDKLGTYLSDGHVHIVAAPGSGKTVLGLEIIRHLNLPTLVFAPTKSIREQWKNRLSQDFLPDDVHPDWVSDNIRDIKHLTISTYQSLSTLFRKNDEVTRLIKDIKKHKIQVLVVDEAHHLRANWWKCLEEIKSSLSNPIVVALTATPPIDVSQAEWNRYSSFCGVVDIEVNIPELVRSGTLSPHQDYVYLNQPTKDELGVLDDFRLNIDKIILDLQLDKEFSTALLHADNQWIQESDGKAHFRKYQTFYLALCILVRNATAHLPPQVTKQYHITSEELPTKLTLTMAKALLEGLFFDLHDRLSEESRSLTQVYRDRLANIGAIEKQQVLIHGSTQLETILKSSPAKLHSITEIIDHELSCQKSTMRAVILADYIRKEALRAPLSREDYSSKIGVAPIFELLRQLRLNGLSLAMLTGSITIIPSTLKQVLKTESPHFLISEIHFPELLYDPEYCYVEVKEGERDKLTLLLTEIFEQGKLNCLVGTAALLGEGWDAPSVNTLILATYVGSFVMSNQMRGRALRKNPKQLDKVSNIWHLATVAPYQKGSLLAQKDFLKLKKRFENFHGVKKDKDKAYIESGLGRVDLSDSHNTRAHNQKMLSFSEKRTEISNLWQEAFSNIPKNRFLRPIREVSIPEKSVTSQFILLIAGERLTGFRHTVGRVLRERRMRKIAISLLKYLKLAKVISQSIQKAHIHIDTNGEKIIVSLPYGSNKDQAIYAECLDQIFNPFYMADYILCEGMNYLMIPKAISKYAIEIHRSLKPAGFRSHKLYSTASWKGQNELMKIRNSFLLNAEHRGKVESKVKWRAEDEV